MADRDPRMQPKPGDVLRRGEQDVLVIAVNPDKVYFSRAKVDTVSFGTLGYFMPLEEWQTQAKDAEVWR